MNESLQSRITAVRETCRKMIELSANVTEGPWIYCPEDKIPGIRSARQVWVAELVPYTHSLNEATKYNQSNGQFIAASRNSTPAAFKCVLEDLDRWEKMDARIQSGLPNEGAWENDCPYCGVSVDVGALRHATDCIVFHPEAALIAICETMEALERV